MTLAVSKTYPHGTRARYALNGCRCLPCTDANRDKERERRARLTGPWRVHHTAGDHWVLRDRRTGEVKRCASRADAFRRRRKLNFTLGFSYPDHDRNATRLRRANHGRQLRAARIHLQALAESGVGARQVAAITGLDRKTIKYVLSKAKQPRPATVDAILGVRVDAGAPSSLVDAIETWRLIDEMLVAGATKTRIARELGSKAKTPAIQLRRDRVQKRSADAVRRLHDRFWRGSARMRAVCRCEEASRSA